MKRSFLLLPLLLVTGLIDGLVGYAIPASSHCKQEDEPFHPGKSYFFNYEVKSLVSTPQSTEEVGAANIECQVQLNAKGECEYTLKVKSCSIKEPPSKLQYSFPFQLSEKEKEFSAAIERYSVGFIMYNGAIEKLFAHKAETPSILNFKRGIISALQIKKRNFNNTTDYRNEMRSDVQGICPVTYRPPQYYDKGDAQQYMVKYTSRCHFPSRTDSPYSPFSLIWNTSFIHTPAIDFTTRCEYSFSEGDLKATQCYEEYRLRGTALGKRGTFTAVRTSNTQKIALIEKSALKPESTESHAPNYQIKHIQYEFERTEDPHGIIPNRKERIRELMDKLLTNPEKVISQNSANWLDELVELLRNSQSLNDVMDQCWVDSTCTTDKYTEKEIQLGNIWMTSLIQCNRVQCTKAFKSMFNWDPKYIQHIITNDVLEWILLAWSNARITDFRHVEMIIDIVEHKFNNRFSISILSSIIYKFQKHYKDEELHRHGNVKPVHRTTLERLFTFIKKPIGKDCSPASGYGNIDVATALLAYANIVPLYEYVTQTRLDLDIFKNCINGKEDHWPISVYALQATKRAQPTKELHTLLWKTLKNPTLRHEDNVMAYKVLAEKFGGANFLKDILSFLEEFNEKGFDYNLRTFIVTHLRAIAKNREPNQLEFSNAIRKAMAYKPNLFKAIPDEKSNNVASHGKDDEYYIRQVPWDIHVDDDLIFDEGHFSTYDENHYKYGTTLPQEFGIGLAQSLLFKEGSYYPYATWVKSYIDLFGQQFNVSHISVISKGLKEFFKALSSHFKDGQEATNSLKNIAKAKEIFQNVVSATPDDTKSFLENFPYEINKEILKNLNRLHNEKVKSNPEASESLDLVYQYGMFDNYLGILSLNDIPKLSKDFLASITATFNSPYKSRSLYWKIIEAETVIPTIVGMPLNWTTDAYLISNFKLETKQSPELDFNKDVFFNVGGSYSGLATLNLAMQLDLPGYVSYGANDFSTVSTNVGANVDFKLDVKKKKFKVQLELPQRPMQLLSYKSINSLIRHHHIVDIPKDFGDRKSENWCSYQLSSLLGFKLCHGHSYVKMSEHDYSKQCSSLAGNVYWNYTTEYIANHKVAFQFGIHAEYDENTNTTTVESDIKSRDQRNAEKFNTLVKWSHKVKKGKFTSEISAPILPTFNIQATREPIGDNGSHLKIKSTIYPGETIYLDIQSQKTMEYMAEKSMNSHLSKYLSSERILMPVTATTINFTNSRDYYGYIYKKHEFPKSTYTDYQFYYKSVTTSYNPRRPPVFSHPTFGKESGSAWLKFHREARESTKSGYSYPISESYNHIKLPEATLRLTTYNGPDQDALPSLAFNYTYQDSETNALLTFINFTSSALTKTEVDHKHFILKANTTMPLISMATEFTVTHEEKSIPETNITWILRKEKLKHKSPPDYSLSWWTPNSAAFTSEVSYVTVDLHAKDDPNPEWKEHESRLRDSYKTILAIHKKKYFYDFTYFKDVAKHPKPKFEIVFKSDPTLNGARYARTFSMNIPTENVAFDASLSLDSSLENEAILWKSILQLPNTKPISYIFNMTSPPSKGYIYVTENLNSKSLKRTSFGVFSYRDPHGNITISSQSTGEPLLDFELNATYSRQKTNINVKHYFVDIQLEANREHGYSSKTDFKSKNLNLIPNMQWAVDYPNTAQGTTIAFKFPDVSKTYYIFSHTEFNDTRLLIDICLEKNCTISDIDSKNFIAEIDLSLENPQILTRTVSFNPQAIWKLAIATGEQIGKTIYSLVGDFTSRPSQDSVLQRGLGVVKNAIRAAAEETADFMAFYLSRLGHNLIRPLDFAFHSLWMLILYPVGVFQQYYYQGLDYSWCTYSLDYNQLATKPLEERILSGWYQPGPIPDKSYVATTYLPVYWTRFNKFPSQISPYFQRSIQEAEEDWTEVDAASRRVFHDEDYERHALFVSTGDIYTFDGRVRHFGEDLRDNCPYLLSHDFEDGKFSIYYQYRSIHFLFPDLSLTIGPTGEIYINETNQVDLPFVNWNGHIRVVRQENRTELTTSYNLKVICTTNDFYCLFYTTESKFNELTGLLGNNNDNPMDEPKDVKHFELSGPHACEGSNRYPFSQPSTDTDFYFFWPSMLWRPESPTLACHDIVSPVDFFAKTYIERSYRFPCALMNAYLALCDAKDVPVGRSPCTQCKQKRYELGQKWESKVEKNVDILFIIDLTYRKSSKQFIKGLESLAGSINNQFLNQRGYRGISFGLVGYHGKGSWSAPQQHTIHGKLLGSFDNFVKYGLKTLNFDGPKKENKTAGLSAIEFAAEHYNLGETSTHFYIIITPKDSESTGSSAAKNLYERHGSVIGTLHVFSDYEEFSNTGIYGLKNDLMALPKEKGKFHFTTTRGYSHEDPDFYEKKPLAKLASLTNGAVWQSSYLEKEESQSKIFNEHVSTEIVENAEKEVSHCRQCQCSVSDTKQIFTYCQKATCKNPVQTGTTEKYPRY